MSWKPFRSAVKCIPISNCATTVFRLEVQVVGTGHEKVKSQDNKLEHIRNGQKRTLKVSRRPSSYYMIDLQAPPPVKTFTFKMYQRTCTSDIQYLDKHNWLPKGSAVAELVVDAEVTVPTDQLAPIPMSPWKFTSCEQMDNWDVVLSVDGTKFYAHRHTLSVASTTFRTMFEGDYCEKNQQEVPVNVEGTNAEHFEAFLQCLYPFRKEPTGEFIEPLLRLADFYNTKPLLEKCIDMLKYTPIVSNVNKLRAAIKYSAADLEDEVIASFTKDDVRALLALRAKDLGEERYQKILPTCAFF